MLNNQDFNSVKNLLYKLTGIILGEQKEIMVFNRMKRFAKSVNHTDDLSLLIKKVENNQFQSEFINAFTTNKTHFFREVYHFKDLNDRVIPTLSESQNRIKVLSSACSTGEESYSIAMTFLNSKKYLNNSINIEITATDIDTDVLNIAKNGSYLFKTHTDDFPKWIDSDMFFLTRNGSGHSEFLAKDNLKKLIQFKKMNLMDSNYPFSLGEFDIIFCRNVLIYFSYEDQREILKKLFKYLKVGGTLYIGHSENPIGLESCIERVGHNMFIKKEELKV